MILYILNLLLRVVFFSITFLFLCAVCWLIAELTVACVVYGVTKLVDFMRGTKIILKFGDRI